MDLEYLMLDEALSENLIEIVEKDSDGSVPELRVMNKSPKTINSSTFPFFPERMVRIMKSGPPGWRDTRKGEEIVEPN